MSLIEKIRKIVKAKKTLATKDSNENSKIKVVGDLIQKQNKFPDSYSIINEIYIGEILNTINSSNIVKMLPPIEIKFEPTSVWEYVDGISLGNFVQKTDISDKIIAQLICQVVFIITQLQTQFYFMHNDLHTTNILVRALAKPKIIQYEIGSGVISLEATSHEAVLFDFGQSQTLPPDMPIQCIAGFGSCIKFSYTRDLLNFLESINIEIFASRRGMWIEDLNRLYDNLIVVCEDPDINGSEWYQSIEKEVYNWYDHSKTKSFFKKGAFVAMILPCVIVKPHPFVSPEDAVKVWQTLCREWINNWDFLFTNTPSETMMSKMQVFKQMVLFTQHALFSNMTVRQYETQFFKFCNDQILAKNNYKDVQLSKASCDIIINSLIVLGQRLGLIAYNQLDTITKTDDYIMSMLEAVFKEPKSPYMLASIISRWYNKNFAS